MKSGIRIGTGLIYADIETVSLASGRAVVVTVRSDHCAGSVITRQLASRDMVGEIGALSLRLAKALDEADAHAPEAPPRQSGVIAEIGGNL